MKHEIEIEGLPDGWEAVAYGHPKLGEYVFLERLIREACQVNRLHEHLIVKKKQPRRIVLEETDEVLSTEKEGYVLLDGEKIVYKKKGHTITPPHKGWREVKECEE